MNLTTRSEAETHRLGRLIGELATGGTVLALYGELGAGKSVLIRGLARGMGISENTPITSPTFTIINQYPSSPPLFHVDLYRIVDSSELDDIGFDEIFTGETVVAVEWAQHRPDDLPVDRLEIQITDAGETLREFAFTAGGQRSGDLLKALQNRMDNQPHPQRKRGKKWR